MLGPNCKNLLLNNTADVVLPPYSHWKRAWNATPYAGQTLLKDGFTKRSTLPTGALGDEAVNSGFFQFSSVALVLASTVIMGGLSLIVFRRYWRTEEVFTSPVRSDWQFTRHHQEGPETTSGEGYRMIRCNPEDDHPLGQLRQGIRSSQPNAVENPTGEPTWPSHNTSEDTLLGPWKDTKWGTSRVSLADGASDEEHDNLIELETEGPNKTFFNPETGEFMHLGHSPSGPTPGFSSATVLPVSNFSSTPHFFVTSSGQRYPRRWKSTDLSVAHASVFPKFSVIVPPLTGPPLPDR